MAELDTTQALALAYGGYALAAGLGVLRDPGRFMRMLDGLRDRAAASYTTGIVVYLIGAATLLLHHRWNGWLAATVTILGCAALLEGLSLLIAPGFFDRFVRRFWQRASIRFWGALSAGFGFLMIGAVLASGGFS